MKLIKNTKRKKMFYAKLAILGVICYILVILVSQQIRIIHGKKVLNTLEQEIKVEEIKKSELRTIAETSEEQRQDYKERLAREKLELAKRGERVFINIAGD